MIKLLLPFALILSAFSLRAQVLINEVSAANLNGLTDGDGDREDWVELYNSGPVSVNLSGWFLSDNPANPQKWVVPNGQNIAAGGYRVIFCSGKNKVAAPFVHTNFKLSQTKADAVVLTQPNGTTVDTYTFDVPNQGDHSYGRSPNGSATWKIYTTPTPGAANGNTAYLSYAPDVDATPDAGFFPGSSQVSLTTDPGFTIRYTTNGSEPTAASALYAAPLNIAATTVVKARAFSANPQILPGFVLANTYFINVSHTLPVVSIAGDNVGNLFNGAQGKPTGSLEYFENYVLEAEAYGELNKHGNDSWAYPQRGVDWVTRDQMGYADELKHKFFKERNRKKFQRLILKAAANDNYPSANGAHIRDAYIHTLAIRGGMDVDARTYRACVLYLNGQYWGVYDMREKVDDADFTDYYYDQDEFDIDYIKTWGNTWEEYGDWTDWYNLKGYILGNNMAVPANYAYVQSQFDLLSLVDYIIINQHTVCKDWLNWNTSWWRGRNPSGGAKLWRYALWDMDATFGHYVNYTGIPEIGPTADPCDVEDISNSGDPQNHIDILMALMANPDFKALYINRYADLLNTSLSCENMNALLDTLTNEIEPEMPKHCSRWGGTVSNWKQNVAKIHDFINTRCQVLDPKIVDCYDVTGPYGLTVKVSPAASPNLVGVNSITPTVYPYTGNYFGDVNINLLAKPAPGWVFDHWEVSGNAFGPDQNTAGIVLDFQTTGMVTAFFVPTGPCLAPTGISADNDLAATAVDWAGQQFASNYLIQYRKVGEVVWTQVSTDQTTWNMDTLAGCSNYEAQIQSVCPQGSSPFADFTFGTPDHLQGFSMADAVLCNSDQATLDASFTGATYQWDDGSSGPTRSVGSPGDYWVKVDLKGCTLTDTARVSQVNASALIEPVLCPGESFLLAGETFDAVHSSGQVSLGNIALHACDSLVNVNLVFLAPAESQLHLTSCDPAAVGVDTVVLSSVAGCDSLIITTTSLVPTSETLLSATSCNPSLVGIDTVVLSNFYGCDSLVITTTTFDPAAISTTALFVQNCDSAAVGVDTVLLTNVAGCDSLVITTTSLAPMSQTLLSSSSCNPALVGIDTLVLSNFYGCDSLVITTTTFDPAAISTTALFVQNCDPAAVGVDTVLLTNVAGCDSLVITTTSLAPTSQTLLSASSCNPGVVGIDTLVLSNFYGCDSLVITATTFDPTAIPVTALSVLHCDPAAVGVDTVILSSFGGCDSLVITTTSLAPTSQTLLNESSCNPDLVGTDTLVLSNFYGCDSLVITTTTFDPSAIPVTSLFVKNCDPAAIGVDTVILASFGGCDSLVITTTTLAPTSQTLLSATSCNPSLVGIDTLVLSNFYGCDSLVITTTSFDPAGISITSLFVKNCNPAAVGVDTVLLTNGSGCDSLVVTTTSLAPTSQTFLTAASCNPNLVGIDTLILANQYGCDSLVITATSFDPAAISITALFVKNCNPAAVGVDTVLLSSVAGCDSLVITTTQLAPFSQTFLTARSCTLDQVGIDTVMLANQYGCDSLVITTVEFAGLDFEASAQDILCFGGKDGLIRLDTVLTPLLPVEVALDNQPTQVYSGLPLIWEDLDAGIYALTATNAEGCTMSHEVEVTESEALHLDFGQQPLSQHLGDSIWVEPSADFQIASAEWSPAAGVVCPSCPATFLNAQQTAIYTLTAFDAKGCSTSASVKVKVDQGIRIYVGNAMHLDPGNPDSRLTIYAGPEVVRIKALQLFDRWGNLIFEQKDLMPNTPSAWDGTYRGKAINPGVMLWTCEVETIDGRKEQLSGDITVLR